MSGTGSTLGPLNEVTPGREADAAPATCYVTCANNRLHCACTAPALSGEPRGFPWFAGEASAYW